MILSYSNTATSPATGTRTVNPQPINFGADWRVISEKPGEIVLTNINASLEAPETIRFAFSEIADVFKTAGMEPSVTDGDSMPASKKGVSVLAQLNTIVVDSSGTRYPAAAHMVLKLPAGAEPEGGSDVLSIIARLLGALYETSATTVDNRMGALIHGALVPVDL